MTTTFPTILDVGKPIVGIDVDGCLANTIESGSQAAFDITGQRYDHDSVVTWAMEESWGIHGELRERFYARWREPGFCAGMKPYPDAVAGVEKLRSFCDVYFITAPFPGSNHWIGERIRWIRDHFGCDQKHVINADAKHLVDVDFLIEDKTATLIAWRKERRRRMTQWFHDQPPTAIRILQNYNKHEPFDGIDVDHMLQAAEAVEKVVRCG